MVYHYNSKYNINYSNKSSYKQFLMSIKKRDKKIMRLAKYDSIHYNVPGFDFFQISKKLYNKNIPIEWSRVIELKNEELWKIEDSVDRKLPDMFFSIFSKSKNPVYTAYSKHNLNYFNSVIRNTVFSKMFLELANLKKIKKFNFLKKIKKYKIFGYLKKYKFIRKNAISYIKKLKKLKYKYKCHVKRAGSKLNAYVTGYKFFNFKKFITLWPMVKTNFFLNDGFYFKMWNINFNKTYPKKVKNLFKPMYYVNNLIHCFSYFFYIKYYSVFHKYMRFIKNMKINNKHVLLKKDRLRIYFKNYKKTYWI